MTAAQTQEILNQGHRNTKERGSNNVHEDTCVICLDVIRERAVAIPCNHCTFDFICLISWLQNHPQCPLCKTALISVEYDWRAPDDYKTFHVSSLSHAQQDDRIFLPELHSWTRLRRFPRERRPHARPWQTTRPENANTAISRRRYIYRHKLYSLHIGSNPQSRFRDFTSVTFSRSSELQSRARMWIRRELQVFDFIYSVAQIEPGVQRPTSVRNQGSAAPAENSEFLLSYIISILSTVDIRSSSSSAQRLLAEFLGEQNAVLFLHELNSWLRSPYAKLDTWDRNVQYNRTLPGNA